MKWKLIGIAEQAEIPMTEEQAEMFIVYMRELLLFNDHTNLTGITDSKEVLEKHFIDSLLLFKAYEVNLNTTVADVGSGAGFPGVPLLIMRPDLQLTLVESVKKKIVFLQLLQDRLKLNMKIVLGRAEEVGKREEYRQSFDMVTARAVAVLPRLAEYCLPLVKVGGVFAALKGPAVLEETKQAEAAISKLGGKLLKVWNGNLPNGEGRGIVIIEKLVDTPSNYPRSSGAIKKKSL